MTPFPHQKPKVVRTISQRVRCKCGRQGARRYWRISAASYALVDPLVCCANCARAQGRVPDHGYERTA